MEPEDVEVILGENDLNDVSEHYQGVGNLWHHTFDIKVNYFDASSRLTISSIIVNENFDSKYFQDNDIAMIKMTNPITFSDKQRGVCKPTKDVNFYTGKHAIGSGWGVLEQDGKRLIFYTFPHKLNKGLFQKKSRLLTP